MANDLDEAEAAISSHIGLDNNDIGALLGRLVRVARGVAKRLATIEARLDALEAIAAPQSTTADASVIDEQAPAPTT